MKPIDRNLPKPTWRERMSDSATKHIIIAIGVAGAALSRLTMGDDATSRNNRKMAWGNEAYHYGEFNQGDSC